MSTIEEYVAWVEQARPGETLVYYVGELGRDRGQYGPKMEWLPNPAVEELAKLVYRDWELGLVELTQAPWERERRPEGLPPRRWMYRATRTSKEM